MINILTPIIRFERRDFPNSKGCLKTIRFDYGNGREILVNGYFYTNQANFDVSFMKRIHALRNIIPCGRRCTIRSSMTVFGVGIMENRPFYNKFIKRKKDYKKLPREVIRYCMRELSLEVVRLENRWQKIIERVEEVIEKEGVKKMSERNKYEIAKRYSYHEEEDLLRFFIKRFKVDELLERGKELIRKIKNPEELQKEHRIILRQILRISKEQKKLFSQEKVNRCFETKGEMQITEVTDEIIREASIILNGFPIEDLFLRRPI